MKKMYNTPKIDVQSVLTEKNLMLLGSPTGPQPGQAPAIHNVAPAVPGDNL